MLFSLTTWRQNNYSHRIAEQGPHISQKHLKPEKSQPQRTQPTTMNPAWLGASPFPPLPGTAILTCSWQCRWITSRTEHPAEAQGSAFHTEPGPRTHATTAASAISFGDGTASPRQALSDTAIRSQLDDRGLIVQRPASRFHSPPPFRKTVTWPGVTRAGVGEGTGKACLRPISPQSAPARRC